MKKRVVAVTIAGVLRLFASHSSVLADPPGGPFWNEIDDAGALPQEAQPVLGVGPVFVIDGQTGPGDFEDMYQIEIVDPDQFVASTNPFVLGGMATFDTQLFLFDINGIGVAANDDCPADPGMGQGACLENLGPAGLNLLQQPGVYFLAISGSDFSGNQNDPQSAGGPIFDQNPRNELTGPDGPGGSDPIGGWSGGGQVGMYQLQLNGADFVIPPSPFEPGTKHVPLAVPCSSACAECPDDAEGIALDPVYLFNGEYYTSHVDLQIKGRGFDFVWGRKYRSQLGRMTTMGNGWDHSYNVFVEPCGPHLILNNGQSRSDLFLQQPDGSWAREEFFQVITQNPDSSFSVTFPDTSTWNLNAFGGNPDDGKLNSIIDRNGNAMTFVYDPAGRLSAIADTLDQPGNPRVINVNYNADGFISSITDFVGRTVAYEYYELNDAGGSFGDLKSVTTPTVTGTPNGNDFPSGKTTTYTYTTGFGDERLNHDLLTITDPKGQTYLTNVYAHTIDLTDVRFTLSDTDLHFDRVVRQIWGDPGDIIDLFYVEQTPELSNNLAVTKAIVNDRAGHVKEFLYDGGHRGVIQREFTGLAMPDQLTTDAVNRPTNQLRVGDPTFFETRFLHNGDSLPIGILHPNLNEELIIYDSANPSRRSQGNRVQHVKVAGPLGGDQAMIVETFEYDDEFGGCCGTNFVTRQVDGRGNETLHTYDSAGNRLQTTHRIPSIVEDFEYNSFGQLTAYVLPDNGNSHRRRDEYTYYGSGPQNGYHSAEIVDAGGFQLTTGYEYDPLGRCTRKVDARGNDELTTFNSLDQVVRQLSRETASGSGIRYEKLTFYDANDNVVRVDTENRDDQGTLQANTHFSRLTEYEILNYPTRICEESGSAALAPTVLDCSSLATSEFVVTELEYDENRNQTLLRFGEASNGNQAANTIATEYDERDLTFRQVRAPGTTAQTTMQHDYDGNRNRSAVRDGIEGTAHVTLFVYDGYNRTARLTDPMGNAVPNTYDANDNLLTTRVDGELSDTVGGGSNIRLYQAGFEYDAVDRLTRAVVEHFDTASQAPIGDGQSNQLTFYSDNSQVVRSVDDNAHESLFTYDTANRRSTERDAAGNLTTFTYDGNANVLTATETEVSDLGNPNEVFVATMTYDGLDRLASEVDNVGNTTIYGFDSRHNRVRMVDAENAESRYAYDGINRLVGSTHDLDGDGADGDGSDIQVTQRWDDSSRLVRRTDDAGNATDYAYDALNRLTLQTYADTTSRAHTYDIHDNRITTVDANGNQCTFTYDRLDRMLINTVVPGPGVSVDTTAESYTYDGMSRLVGADDNDATVTRSHDSLSRVVSETLNGVATTSVYDGEFNQLQCVYPGGRTITRTYDELDRVRTITEGAGSIATYDYIGGGRIERRDHGNGTRAAFTYDGLLPNPPGDFGERMIVGTTHTAIGSGMPIDTRSYHWDRVGNKTGRADERAGGAQLSQEYSYDALYRLTRAVERDAAQAVRRDTGYAYDGIGNRLSVSGGPNAGPYVLDGTAPDPADLAVNQYTATAFDERSYDANGNLTRIVAPLSADTDNDGDVDLVDFARFSQCFGGVNQVPPSSCPVGVDADYDNDGDVDNDDYNVFVQCLGGPENGPASECPIGGVVALITYDYRDRMVAYQDVAGGVMHTYAYDALDRRIERQVETTGETEVTRYYYDEWQVCEERDGAGVTTATYVYGAYLDDVLNMRRDGADYYYHADDIFSVMAITDSNGVVVERYAYDDFGRPLILDPTGGSRTTSAIGNPYLFTGRRFDRETEWYYYRTRYFDPRAGRFTTRDTQGYWADDYNTGNAAAFVGSNPLSMLDPMGEAGFTVAQVMDAVLRKVKSRDGPQNLCGRIGNVKLMNFLRNVGFSVMTTPLEVAAGSGVFGKAAKAAKDAYDNAKEKLEKAKELRDKINQAMRTGDIVVGRARRVYVAPCNCAMRLMLNTKTGYYSASFKVTEGSGGECCSPWTYSTFSVTGQAKWVKPKGYWFAQLRVSTRQSGVKSKTLRP